jgi:hypothetical protein
MTPEEALQRTKEVTDLAYHLVIAMQRLQRDGVHKALGLTWRAYVERYFDVSLDWYYRERRAAEAAEKVANCDVPTTDMARDTITTLGELPPTQIPVVYAIASQTTSGKVTAASVREAAARIGEFVAQESVNGYPATEIIAAGIIEEQRDRAILNSKRVYIVNNVEATDSRVICFTSRILEVFVPLTVFEACPRGKQLRASIWYEDESGGDDR